jgi:hypothetical protein
MGGAGWTETHLLVGITRHEIVKRVVIEEDQCQHDASNNQDKKMAQEVKNIVTM